MKQIIFLILFTFSIQPLAFSPIFAAPAKPQVRKIVLPNGMKVLMLERHNMPGVAFRMYYKVGSVDEEMGQTGLAHMFEHMAFKGTKTLNTKDYAAEKKVMDQIEALAEELNRARAAGASKEKLAAIQAKMEEKEKEADKYRIQDEYEKIYESMGAWGFNAFTGNDLTGYTVSLPSNRLEDWFILESDRFQNGVLREFYRERNVVQEERRMRTDSNPIGKLWELFIANAFIVSPYQRGVIGWMSDLQSFTADQARRFHESRYTPQRCIISIVGDINLDETEAKVRKYFGAFPAKNDAVEFSGEEPEQKGERRVELLWESEPFLMMGWHKPNAPHPDDVKLALLARVLDQGRTSRFYKNLVEKQAVALEVNASHDEPGVRYPNLFMIYGAPRSPHDALALEKAVEGEIEAIKKTPPEDWELQRVRNNLEVQVVRKLDSNEGLAGSLANDEMFYGNWAYSWDLLAQFEKIKPEDLSEVARKYLNRGNKTTGYVTKEKGSKS